LEEEELCAPTKEKTRPAPSLFFMRKQKHAQRRDIDALALAYRRAIAGTAKASEAAVTAAVAQPPPSTVVTTTAATPGLPGSAATHVPAPEAVLFYSVRPSTGPVPPLSGRARLGSGHTGELPTQPHDPDLLGQVDGVEGGIASGWACVRSGSGGGNGGGKAGPPPLRVSVYVDGVHVGDAEASGPTPHPLVHRLCSTASAGGKNTRGGGPNKAASSILAADAGTTPPAGPGASGVGWTVRLPPLPQGRHEVRAFASNAARTARQELSQSPLPFLETASSPDPGSALARKDAIIRVRNAQVAALWDELHTRQPWRNALADGGPVSFGSATVVGAGGGGNGQDARAGITPANGTTDGTAPPPYTAVLAINTGLGARARRDALRRTWVPSLHPGGLAALERDHRIVVRFFVGYSDSADDPAEAALAAEAAEHGDIVRLDHVDTYADLSAKTLKLFAALPALWDAAFYFKVDDDVAVNVPALAAYLDARRGEGNLYLGCMKSGAVLTDRRYKWCVLRCFSFFVFWRGGWMDGMLADTISSFPHPKTQSSHFKNTHA
jgi:hypothetical protein